MIPTTPTRELANVIARAVFDKIEVDRMLVLNNIEQAIEDALILHGAKSGHDGGSRGSTRLTSAARKMINECISHGVRGSIASCFDNAFDELEKALRDAQAL
jgi:hypothetical protein